MYAYICEPTYLFLSYFPPFLSHYKQRLNTFVMIPRKPANRPAAFPEGTHPFRRDTNKSTVINKYKPTPYLIFSIGHTQTFIFLISLLSGCGVGLLLLYHRITSRPFDCEMCPPTVTFLNH